jgi:hypothetical protein
VQSVLGYPHASTSISISKKKYFILVIEILYSISISSAPVLSLSHTLYLLFPILFSSLLLSLSLTLFLSLATVFGVVRTDRYMQRCVVRPERAIAFAGTFAGLRCGPGAHACLQTRLPLHDADSLTCTTPEVL